MRNDEPLLPISNMADTTGKSNDVKRKKVLVVGAGAAGALVRRNGWCAC
jgi:NADPH-dependent 2,4-dienoyl-CoA reductase/sulfur reductase-like enzyme